MSRQYHSKSGLFLMELLISLLLFCVLCGCGLMFFIKSYNIAGNATALHHAVSITSSVAGIYETGDGSLSSLAGIYPKADVRDDSICIYLDRDFLPCSFEESIYEITASLTDTKERLDIIFFNADGMELYHIQTRHFTPGTPASVKEVTVP